MGPALARVLISSGTVWATVATNDAAQLGPALETLRSALPDHRRQPRSAAGVCFQLWREDQYGHCEDEFRILDANNWDEIAPNYSAATREGLEALATTGPPGESEGRALIWHGDPGTGKTYALRALGQAWRAWCDVHVVVDAERFLANVSYMNQVLDYRTRDDRWRLIALEDTGELLTADARERVGQGLSRLLNATDGVFGQGTRALVLVTTNEPLAQLHPAMARPGRCLSEVEFTALSAGEANAWLSERSDKRVDRATTIAELYELLSDRVLPNRGRQQASEPIGFAARRAA